MGHSTFPPIATMAPSLTSLRLECDCDVQPERTLVLCPQLIVLLLDYKYSDTPRRLLQTIHPPPKLPGSLRLRSLTLNGVSLNADWIRKQTSPMQCVKMLLQLKRYERQENIQCFYARTPFSSSKQLSPPLYLEKLGESPTTSGSDLGDNQLDDIPL